MRIDRAERSITRIQYGVVSVELKLNTHSLNEMPLRAEDYMGMPWGYNVGFSAVLSPGLDDAGVDGVERD